MKKQSFLCATMPAYANRAPIYARRSLQGPELTTLFDASWELQPSGMTVVAAGTLLRMPDEPVTEEALVELTGIRGDEPPVRRELRGPDGPVSGWVVTGELGEGGLGGPSCLARSFVTALAHGKIVIELRVTVRGTPGVVLFAEDLDEPFERVLAGARLEALPTSLPSLAHVSPRLVFEHGAIMATCDGLNWGAITPGGQLVETCSIHAGLADVGEVASPLFALDGQGAFHFTREFEATRRLERIKCRVRVGDAHETLPVDLFTGDGEAGFAFVRDEVLHLVTFDGDDGARARAALDTLALVDPWPRLDELLAPDPDESAALTRAYGPMPQSMAALRAASKAKPRKPARSKKPVAKTKKRAPARTR